MKSRKEEGSFWKDEDLFKSSHSIIADYRPGAFVRDFFLLGPYLPALSCGFDFSILIEFKTLSF